MENANHDDSHDEIDFSSTFGSSEIGLEPKTSLIVPNNVLKNIERIKGIRSIMFATTTVTLYTPIARRQLRRDFNIACAKMYVYGLNKTYKAEIVASLASLEFAIELLEMDVALWQGQSNPLTPCVFEMLLVSPQSVRMMRALQRLDKCMLGVYSAYLSDLITKAEKSAVLRPFHIAYINFKRVAMKLDMNESAKEIVETMEREVNFT